MEIYTIILSSMVLLGVGIIIGIFAMVIRMNGKINKIYENVTQQNDSFNDENWSSGDDFYKNEAKIKTSRTKSKILFNETNIKSYIGEVDAQLAATSETNHVNTKRKSNQTIGIVFCRNCASQFTSDKNICPSCGSKRL